MSDVNSSGSSSDQTNPKKPLYTRPRFISSLIAAIIFLILIFQNSETIAIDVFFWNASAPAALLYLVFSVIGFIVGWLVRRPKISKKPTS